MCYTSEVHMRQTAACRTHSPPALCGLLWSSYLFLISWISYEIIPWNSPKKYGTLFSQKYKRTLDETSLIDDITYCRKSCIKRQNVYHMYMYIHRMWKYMCNYCVFLRINTVSQNMKRPFRVSLLPGEAAHTRVRGWPPGERGGGSQEVIGPVITVISSDPEGLPAGSSSPVYSPAVKWVIGSESLCIFVMSWQHISTPCLRGSPNQHGHAFSLLVTALATMAVTKQNVKRRTDVCVCVFWVGFTAPPALHQHHSFSRQPSTRSLLCSKELLSRGRDRWFTRMWHVCECDLYVSQAAHTPNAHDAHVTWFTWGGGSGGYTCVSREKHVTCAGDISSYIGSYGAWPGGKSFTGILSPDHQGATPLVV